MHVAVIALSLHALSLHALPPATPDLRFAALEDRAGSVAQADPSDSFGDPPPPPAVGTEADADEGTAAPEPGSPAPAPTTEPSTTAPPTTAPPATAPPTTAPPDEEAEAQPVVVDAMLAGIITGVGSAVLAVPAAALCGLCSCFACPGPLVCVPLGTAGSAAGGLLFAGAELGDVILPSLAAGAISLGSGVLALGSVGLYAILTGALGNLSNVTNTPVVGQGLGAVHQLITVAIVLGALSLGAVGAGAAVVFMAPDGDLDETARTVELTAPDLLDGAASSRLASARPTSAMAY